MKAIFFSLSFILCFLSCQSGSKGSGPDRDMGMGEKATMPAMEEAQLSGGGQPAKTDIEIKSQKIIRNGSMNISVKNALKAKEDVDVILKKFKAYVGNEQLDNNDYQTSYHLQIRVPALQMDSLIAALEAMDGTVTFKSINASDVTEEYIDLETRLTNKRSYLDQYRQLLKSARSIEDILKVREQIRVLEEEIESVEGRLRYLSNQIDLSTLDLTLLEKKDFVYKPDRKINFLERLKESVSAGWFGFLDFSLYILTLWPFWLILFGIWFLWKRLRKKK
jgi:hypothetical protein